MGARARQIVSTRKVFDGRFQLLIGAYLGLPHGIAALIEGAVVTPSSLETDSQAVVRFYSKRGTAVQHGTGVAAREHRLEFDGIGTDTWGVDYGLLGGDGALIGVGHQKT